jgi:hypothetical protein
MDNMTAHFAAMDATGGDVDGLTAHFAGLSASVESDVALIDAADDGDVATVARLLRSHQPATLRAALHAAVCNPLPSLAVVDFLLQYCPVDRELYLDAMSQTTFTVFKRLTRRVAPALVHEACARCITQRRLVWDPEVYWFLTGIDYTSPNHNALSVFFAEE